MTAFHLVRFCVRPEAEADFLDASANPACNAGGGLRAAHLVRLADHDYCLIAEWDSLDDLDAARAEIDDEIARLAPYLSETAAAVVPPGAQAYGEAVAHHRFTWPQRAWSSG